MQESGGESLDVTRGGVLSSALVSTFSRAEARLNVRASAEVLEAKGAWEPFLNSVFLYQNSSLFVERAVLFCSMGYKNARESMASQQYHDPDTSGSLQRTYCLSKMLSHTFTITRQYSIWTNTVKSHWQVVVLFG